MLQVFLAEPLLANGYEGYAPRLDRPMTKFERIGIGKGHEVVDLVFIRRDA